MNLSLRSAALIQLDEQVVLASLAYDVNVLHMLDLCAHNI